MTAIILTEQQSLDLEAANAAANANRALKPRILQDGRLILNADILDDPFFADPSRPWAAILGITPPESIDESPGEGALLDSALRTQNPALPKSPSPQSAQLSIVTLTAADLAEPAP
jgi:hypothetical protein